MSLNRFLWVIGLVLILGNKLSSQCTMPDPTPGLFCDPSVPDGAPLICNLDCLDGYTARMPPIDSAILQFQPPNLCDTGNQGSPNNLSWFAFVAGSTDIVLEITPFNCTVGDNGAIGVQAGIFTKCYTWDRLYCIGAEQQSTFQIGGPGFIEGETYFFFIDGFNGSICDYTVNVVQGDQPFPLPDIDSIIVDFAKDTLCVGGNAQLRLTGLTQDSIDYTYTISPATIDYPSGFHPESKRAVSNWTFSESGDFQICVEATNGCDVTPTYCRDITVQKLQDEVFTNVPLCMEDLATYMGPSTEDPNGDGTPGWLGTGFFVPGVNRDTIYEPSGCFYVQEITIDMIGISAREDVTLDICTSDFPFLYEGNLINGPVDNLPLSLVNGAATGCDSLVNLTVRDIYLDGTIQLNGCSNNLGVLTFSVTDFPRDNESILVITWEDASGNAINSVAGDPNSIEISASGVYTVFASVTTNGVNCSFSFDSENIDINNLRPASPVLTMGDTILCEDGMTSVYKASGLIDAADMFSWSYPAGIQNATNAGDSLVIEWGTIAGGHVCVSVTNSCGTSDLTCVTVSKLNKPIANIIADIQTCANDTTVITFDGDPTWTYNWSTTGARLIDSSTMTTSGPHLIVFDEVEGARDIDLTIDDGNCVSDLIRAQIEVISQIDTPMVSCIATDNTVQFIWDNVANAVDYQITVLTGNSGMVDGNSYLVEGLNPDDEVSILIRALAANDCAHSQEIQVTCIAGCDPLEFILSADKSTICSGDVTDQIQLTTSGDTDMGVVDYISEGVSAEGIFTPGNLDAGIYELISSLTTSTCVYYDTVMVEVLFFPEYTLDISHALCVEDQEGMLSFTPGPETDFLSYTVDGNPVSENDLMLDVGTHMVEITAPNGCVRMEQVNILPAQDPGFRLESSIRISEGSIIPLEIELGGFDTMNISNIDWYDDTGSTLCNGDYNDCGILEYEVQTDIVICADITYFDECIVTVCTEIDAVRVVSIFAPTVFTPNDDGRNDQFFVTSNQSDIVFRKFRVFDRWGQAVFSSENIVLSEDQATWDGKMKGNPALPGVYVYIVEYEEEGQTYIRRGDVTLIR